MSSGEWVVTGEPMPLESPDEWKPVGEPMPLEKPPVSQESVAPEPSFMGGVGESLSKRAGNVANIFTADIPADESLYGAVRNAPMRILQAAGQGAGFINDVALEGMKSGYRNLMPEPAKAAIESGVESFMQEPVVQSGVKTLSDAYGVLKQKFPEGMKNVEAAANIGGAIPVIKGVTATGKAAFGAGKEAVNIVGDTASFIAQPSAEGAARQVENAIRYGVEKSIRPSVSGKGNATQIKAYEDKAVSAVKSIVDNKENLILTDIEGDAVKGALPKSLKQFSEAIDQTKKGVFRQYDDLMKQAGEGGATVDLNPVVAELEKVGKGAVLQDLSPEVANYAATKAKIFAKRGGYTAEEAQDAIAHLNKSLEAFYRNPSYENATKAGIDALIANNLRKSLDNAIETAVGPGYQDLKNAYGSLKTIETDVAHRAIVDARKNVKGLIDFADIFTSGELLAGIATMNPNMVVRAGSWKAVKEYFKLLNNPNRIVGQMFGDVERIVDKQKGFLKSKTMRSLTGRETTRTMPESPFSEIPPRPDI